MADSDELLYEPALLMDYLWGAPLSITSETPGFDHRLTNLLILCGHLSGSRFQGGTLSAERVSQAAQFFFASSVLS